MTSEEARRAVADCENNISQSYGYLRTDLYNLSEDTYYAGKSYKLLATVIPLLASAIGMIFCMFSSWGWGILLILGGILGSVYSNSKAAETQKSIEKEKKNLDDFTNSKPTI